MLTVEASLTHRENEAHCFVWHVFKEWIGIIDLVQSPRGCHRSWRKQCRNGYQQPVCLLTVNATQICIRPPLINRRGNRVDVVDERNSCLFFKIHKTVKCDPLFGHISWYNILLKEKIPSTVRQSPSTVFRKCTKISDLMTSFDIIILK